MKITSSKVFSVGLLIVVGLIFSGLPESAAAFVFFSTAEKPPCCDECGKGETEGPVHCATPDCPVFVCLSMNLDTPFALSGSFESFYIHPVSPKLVLKSLPKSIFHPPRA